MEFLSKELAQSIVEKTMNVALIERDIDYKSMEDNLSNQYKEYSNYRKVYEDLSIELKETW